MIKNNYKKIAMGNFNKIETWRTYEKRTISMPINFKASFISVEIEINGKGESSYRYICVKNTADKLIETYDINHNGFIAKVKLGMDRKSIEVYVQDASQNPSSIKLLDWIAIE